MNKSTTPHSPADSAAAPAPDDPRFGFAKVTEAIGNLIDQTSPDSLTNATPCPDFTVKELLDHMVMVMGRVAVVGRGEHWSSIDQVAIDSGWHDDYTQAAHEVMTVWSDPEKLEQVFEVPWGEMPGAPLIFTYTAELAVHGWDLANATNREFAIDDNLLHGALAAAKFIPAEGRGTPEVPFGPVVDPGADAPVLDQMAGWLGRDVLTAS